MNYRNKGQSGRSMVELIGVLVILTSLSVGSLGGYEWAMNRYRSFRVLTGLQNRMILANVRRKAGQTLTYRQKQIEEKLMDYTVSYEPSYTNSALDIENGKKITIFGLDKKMCSTLKNDQNIIALQTAGNAIIFMNDAPIEEYSICVDFKGNTLAVIMHSSGAERRFEPLKERCSFHRHYYDSGDPIADCGSCDDGKVVEDKSRYNSDCQICNTTTWKVSNLEDGTHPFTTGAEANKCCVNGSLTYHEILCPKKCILGTEVYTSGDPIGACSICNNGEAKADTSKYDSACQTCDVLTGALTNKTGTCNYNGGTGNGICSNGICTKNSNECDDGYFKASNGACIACSDLNRQTASAIACSSCGSSRKVVGNYCDPVCPSGWFQNTNGNCTICSNTAAKATSATECAKCDTTDFKRTMSNGKCTLSACPSGYFKQASGICESCSDSATIEASSAECQKCSNRMFVDGYCSLCQTGTFGDSHTCCSDISRRKASATECAKCGSLREVVGSYCDLVCPSGWFKNANGNCTICSNTNAKETSAAECSKCDATDFKRTMKSGKCTLSACPSGYFKQASGICKSCSDPTPYKSTAADCETCNGTGYPRKSSSGYCVLDEANVCYGITCNGHGSCTNGSCTCTNNYWGTDCENPPLDCQNGGIWDTINHVCNCANTGYTGATCETKLADCPAGTYTDKGYQAILPDRNFTDNRECIDEVLWECNEAAGAWVVDGTCGQGGHSGGASN